MSSSSGTSLPTSTFLSLALTPNSNWPEKDHLLDALYWLRQVLGLALGLLFGLIPLKGLLALALFAAASVAAGYFYCTSFQGVDEEDYGGLWELTKEGFMTSFAGFLVTWIIVYSGLHFD